MESVSKIGDVVIMENGERYVVLDCVEYEDEMYLKINGVIDNGKKQEYVSGFVKEIISKDDNYSLEIVNNQKLIDILNETIMKFAEENPNETPKNDDE